MEIVHFLSNVSGHSASTERPAPRRPSRSKAAPKDIESLISNNLMKLRSLSPSSKAAIKATDEGSNLTYDRLDVSKSVLVEMRGKNPPPPLPVEKSERIYIKKKAPAPPPPPPPIPPKPPSPKARKRPPIRPPAPKIDLMDVNYVEESNKDDIESLYARVKKDSIRPER